MAMFYDWRNREGKGMRPLREQLRELRSPIFIALGILLLVLVVFGCRHDSSENLMGAHELLGLDRVAFVKRLKEQFIVQEVRLASKPFYLPHIYYNDAYWVTGYELQGQGIYISCRLLDDVDLPGTIGVLARSRARLREDHGMIFKEDLKSKEKEDGETTEIKRQLVAIIEILLPYEVSKSTAVKMLGYQLFPGEYSEDGFWQDKESGDTITVTHGTIGEDWNIDLKTRIMVSVGSRPTNTKKVR